MQALRATSHMGMNPWTSNSDSDETSLKNYPCLCLPRPFALFSDHHCAQTRITSTRTRANSSKLLVARDTFRDAAREETSGFKDLRRPVHPPPAAHCCGKRATTSSRVCTVTCTPSGAPKGRVQWRVGVVEWRRPALHSCNRRHY